MQTMKPRLGKRVPFIKAGSKVNAVILFKNHSKLFHLLRKKAGDEISSETKTPKTHKHKFKLMSKMN